MFTPSCTYKSFPRAPSTFFRSRRARLCPPLLSPRHTRAPPPPPISGRAPSPLGPPLRQAAAAASFPAARASSAAAWLPPNDAGAPFPAFAGELAIVSISGLCSKPPWSSPPHLTPPRFRLGCRRRSSTLPHHRSSSPPSSFVPAAVLAGEELPLFLPLLSPACAASRTLAAATAVCCRLRAARHRLPGRCSPPSMAARAAYASPWPAGRL